MHYRCCQASRLQPSIIFFDEIDGLAPMRSSKQDYIHASIVSTLLALMDGLDSRGQACYPMITPCYLVITPSWTASTRAGRRVTRLSAHCYLVITPSWTASTRAGRSSSSGPPTLTQAQALP